MITSDSITEMCTLHQRFANLIFSASEGLMQVGKKQLPFPSSTQAQLIYIEKSFC